MGLFRLLRMDGDNPCIAARRPHQAGVTERYRRAGCGRTSQLAETLDASLDGRLFGTSRLGRIGSGFRRTGSDTAAGGRRRPQPTRRRLDGYARLADHIVWPPGEDQVLDIVAPDDQQLPLRVDGDTVGDAQAPVAATADIGRCLEEHLE